MAKVKLTNLVAGGTKTVDLGDIKLVKAYRLPGNNNEFLKVCTEIIDGIYCGGVALKKDNKKLFGQGVLPDPHKDLLVRMKTGRKWIKFPLDQRSDRDEKSRSLSLCS